MGEGHSVLPSDPLFLETIILGKLRRLGLPIPKFPKFPKFPKLFITSLISLPIRTKKPPFAERFSFAR